ncbi:hypothetical protein A2U01_0053781, partial [Trifolium medium]|nr:hypothetical protein [Trifolium medium]
MGKWVRGEFIFRLWRMIGAGDTRHERGGVFSVKSAYLVLDKRARPQRILPGDEIENLAR